MTESAYLKASVGPVLAKALAETVLAQPSNPQEYFALYLLHVLQEEERASAAAARMVKAEMQRQAWATERSLREKRAADTIQRFVRQWQTNLHARRAAEEELWKKYEDAVGEAEDLLEELHATEKEEDKDVEKEEKEGDEANADAIRLEDAAFAVEEARAEFYKAQRFMLRIRKAFIGDLKHELVNRRKQVRMEQDKVHDMLDAASEDAREKEEAEVIALATRGALPNSAATAPLVRQVAQPRHDRISSPMILFRVLRCWCYFLFDSTPKQVSTPTSVAALVKPFTFMQLLRSFNPVASYRRSEPLRLEQKRGGNAEGGADDMQYEDEPIEQPKPRQARRVSRILRVLMHDNEYLSSVNVADYIDADNPETEEEREALEASSEAAGRAEKISASVEETARKHSVMLYALLRMLRTASAYRDARDLWVQLLVEGGHEVPAGEELPEDGDNDPNDEEALRDADGEVDDAAVRRLLLQIGVDTDEALAKLWAESDEAETAKWKAVAAARSVEEMEGEGGEEEMSEQ
ncbi:hypothetical protein TRVL_07882 [Trypanosoma vivax]|nr:hypothetical protein TRVL_07882 [Trypanosoma vivax]